MIIGGLQKTTLIDFPGKLACTVFLAGCNFRCPWCYSRELVLPLEIARQPRISEKEFFDFLRERQGLLEGVVICGGEPTINKDLPQFLQKIKNLGFVVKLDTNGSNPEMLKDLIDEKLIDYVAMDIKASPEANFQEYGFFTRVKKPYQSKNIYKSILTENATLEDIKKSVEILKKGLVNFEFRSTVVPGVHRKQDFVEIAKWIGGKNVKYYLQNFRPEKTIAPEFEKIKPYPDKFLREIASEIKPYFKLCELR